MTKGVPLLYNVNIMNKTTTTTTTNKSKSHERSELAAKPLKSHERSELAAKPLKSHERSELAAKPLQEDDTFINIIGTIIGMGLAAVLFFGVILPIISAPNFGAKVLFFIVFWWLYLILGLLGVKIF